MKRTIITVGSRGYNIAIDIINAGLFPDSQIIICDTDESQLKSNAKKMSAEAVLLEKYPYDKIKVKYINSVDEVTSRISPDVEEVIICSTLGGMTGSKYAPLIAMAEKLKGKTVCTLGSLPMTSEGKLANMRAAKAKRKLAVASDLIVLQCNESIQNIKGFTLLDMNKPLVEVMKSFLENHSIQDLSLSLSSSRNGLLPIEYQDYSNEYFFIRGCFAKGITEADRVQVFDL